MSALPTSGPVTPSRECLGCGDRSYARRCRACGAPTALILGLETAPLQPTAGQILARRYRVDALLYEGSMANLFRGRDLVAARDIALKVLPPSPSDPERQLRWLFKEAQLLGRLRHPHIARHLTFGVDDMCEIPFLAMELIHGETLDAALARGPLDARTAITLLRQVASALAEAHRLDIAHLDLKPANVMVDGLSGEAPKATLVDFGIANVVVGECANCDGRADLVGTPSWMSPEQALGLRCRPTADVYALGLLLYAMLTGHAGFEGSTPLETLTRQVIEEAPPLPARLVDGQPTPAALRSIYARLVAKSPDHRPRTAGEVVAALAPLRG